MKRHEINLLIMLAQAELDRARRKRCVCSPAADCALHAGIRKLVKKIC